MLKEGSVKLHRVKEKSIIFNKEIFGNIFRQKHLLEAQLKGVQRELIATPSTGLVTLEKDLQKELLHVLHREELLWFQKSREKWVKLGDCNTHFSHTQTVIRRGCNRISSLFIDDNWCVDEDVLHREALCLIKRLFYSQEASHPSKLVLPTIPSLSLATSSTLTREVSKAEVYSTLMAMESFNAPVSYGF